MSVPKGKRSEGELRALTKANELMSYTITICSNENYFPKRYRWTLTNRIVSTTADITDMIIHANSVRIKSEDDKESIERRIKMIDEALELTYVLMNQIQIAYQVFKKLSADRIEYWTAEVIELRSLLRGWRKGHRL